MKRSLTRALRAFSLVEMMAGTAICTTIFGLSIGGLMSMQRSFLAADFQSTAENDQLRVSDYLSGDLRPATSVIISNNGKQIDVTIPADSSSITQVHLNIPVLGPLLGGIPVPAPRQVRYSLSGTDLYRTENNARVLIAQNLTTFQATQTGTTVNVNSSFQPQYSGDPTHAPQIFTALYQTVLARYAAH